jgi:serine/threonine protein kinase
MKVCTTCGRQWDNAHDRCPEDGTALSSGNTVTTGQLAVLAAESDRLAPGTVVGEYTIERVIGEGGMGMVYGARHPVIGKRAAIKVLNAQYSAAKEAVARFVQEAQAVNRIGHANIVDIFSFGTLPDGRSYFVMEWLQGESLGERIAKGALPIADTVAILVSLARALDAAHAAGIIHRDLKPDNVYLVAEDEGVRVKLLDFGIAKLSTGGTASKTATGVVVGTPHYMAPEQARGQALDGRTDLYALGAVAYAMVAGESPFERESSAVETLHAHITKPPVPPRERRPDVPAALDSLILELLAKDPGARPSLAEVRRRLAALGTRSVPVAVQVEPSAPIAAAAAEDAELDVPPRRARWPLAVGAVAVIAIATTVFVAVRRGGGSDDTKPTTPRAAASAPSPPAPAPAPPAPAPPPPPAVEPAPNPIGHLDLAIEPATAAVTIDGEKVALVRGRANVSLDQGKHELAAAAPGYKTASHSFEIAPDKTTPIVVKLERPRRVPAVVAPVRPAEPADSDGVKDPFKHKP